MSMKTNLFIVGTPKSGTTALYEYLRHHADVFLPEIKETNYFSHREIARQQLYYKAQVINHRPAYEELYASASSQKWLLDASVSYLYYKDVPERIFQYNPKARIIILLRDPTERAFSHFLMDKRLGFLPTGLDTIFEKKLHDHRSKLAYQQCISLGLYYEQVKRYLDVFPQNQIRIFFHHEVKADRTKWLAEVCAFLDISPLREEASRQEHNAYSNPKNKLVQSMYKAKWLRSGIRTLIPKQLQKSLLSRFFDNTKPELDPQLKLKLRAYYKNDIQKLESLVDKDLSNWYA